MPRRRFGVSLPEDIAESLDELARRLGRDRSSIVEDALREYMHDHLHFLEPHRCTGILLIIRSRGRKGFSEIVEKHQDVIRLYSHLHVDGRCIETLYVSGDSTRIACLAEELERMGCRTRYIPLGYTLGESGEGC